MRRLHKVAMARNAANQTEEEKLKAEARLRKRMGK